MIMGRVYGLWSQGRTVVVYGVGSQGRGRYAAPGVAGSRPLCGPWGRRVAEAACDPATLRQKPLSMNIHDLHDQ